MKRWFTRRRMLVLLFIATVLAPFAWIFGRRAYSAWDLSRVMAHLDATDPDWRIAHTLAKRINISDDKNTALKIAALGKVIGSSPTMAFPAALDLVGIEYWRKPMHGFSKEQFDIIERELAKFKAILPKVRALKDAPPGQFPQAEQLLDAHHVVKLLRWDVIRSLHLKQNQAAMNSWLAQLPCSRSVPSSSNLNFAFFRAGLRNGHLQSLQEMLGQSEWTGKQLAIMQTEVEKDLGTKYHSDSVRVERAELADLFTPARREELQRNLDQAADMHKSDSTLMAWIAKMQSEDYAAALAFGLRKYTKLMTLEDLSSSQREARLREIEREQETAPAT